MILVCQHKATFMFEIYMNIFSFTWKHDTSENSPKNDRFVLQAAHKKDHQIMQNKTNTSKDPGTEIAGWARCSDMALQTWW